MKLRNMTRIELIHYTAAQLAHFFPDKKPGNIRSDIEKHIDQALDRLKKNINAVLAWPGNEFNYMQSSQYCHYLYFLANTIWQETEDVHVCTKLFLLNKVLNGIDCFYEIKLPDIFYFGHSVGIVLAKATYSDYMVMYQNATVGKNHGVAPILEEGVVLYPNTAIIGRSRIRKGTIVSQGTSVINQDTPGECVVYPGIAGKLVFKPPNRAVLKDIFRDA
ncbi:MAG: LbetaH domain-containing protein [Vulcanimicrobiaceae bacterium]